MIDCEKEKLQFESLPEFIREPCPTARESYMTSPSFSKSVRPEAIPRDLSLPKSAELEALWPGVNHDFLQPARRSSSFYLTVGFMVGAIVSLVAAWSYSFFVKGAVPGTHPIQKKIVVAGARSGAVGSVKDNIASERGQSSVHAIVVEGQEVIVPAYGTYEVKAGDTLASIAYKAYKRVSPRLLDSICKANGMRNANVLSLGQKLVLPEYHPQASQITAGVGQLQ
ncbi:MAG: LysM peptidoglycan-binding domain-containing protein [Candidatus Melainabacteria bacterium]|nr:LysM peptidoglycan-binding domain-containing protein [Candidatus Melainabacteria bacterium]